MIYLKARCIFKCCGIYLKPQGFGKIKVYIIKGKIGISQNQNFETIYTNICIIMDKIPTNLEIIYIVLRDPILEQCQSGSLYLIIQGRASAYYVICFMNFCLSKFIGKLEGFTKKKFSFVIIWKIRNIRQLFNLKDNCGKSYMSETGQTLR